MRSNKHLTISQRLYLLTVDTNAKAFAKLDREEMAGIRSWWTWRLFHWHSLMHGELMSRLAAHDAQAAEIARLTAEVAALKPAAEAWNAQEAWRIHDGRDRVGLSILYQRRNDTAARAREAQR